MENFLVELHVFNFNNQLNSERAQICLYETLKHQSNFVLHIWSERDKEIADIIENSKFCKRILAENPPYYASVYDYVKLHIMQKYGGWFFELDQIIETDLGKIEVEEGKCYLNDNEYGHFTATSWNPVYVSKGSDLSETIINADENLSKYLEQDESIICELSDETAKKVGAERIIEVEFSHIDTGSFNKPSLYGYDRVYYEKDGFLWCYYFKTGWKRKYFTFEVFEKVGRHFKFFEEELPKLCENGHICFSESLYEKSKKLYKLPKNITIL